MLNKKGESNMYYHGEEGVKRLNEVIAFNLNELNNPTSPLGFIKSRSKLKDYVALQPGKINTSSQLMGQPRLHTFLLDDFTGMKSFERNGETYWYGIEDLQTGKFETYYRELPLIIDNNRFHWKKNKKYGTMECVLVDYSFEYHIIYNKDGDATIDVKYNACENRHRNKVTIATIDVENAANEYIEAAINEWKENFMVDVKMSHIMK